MTGATRLEPNVRRLDLFPELGANRCHLGKGQVGSKPVIVRIEPSSDYGVVGNMIIQTDVLQFCFRDLAFPVQIQTEPNDCIRIGSEDDQKSLFQEPEGRECPEGPVEDNPRILDEPGPVISYYQRQLRQGVLNGQDGRRS